MNEQTAPSAEQRRDPLSGFVVGLFVLLLIELVAGALLSLWYTPTAEGAYASVRGMGDFRSVVRGFHYWASGLLIAGSFVALVWFLWRKQFAREHALAWYAVVLLFACSMLFQISGNLLPFDRHGVQTAVIEAGHARSTPLRGDLVAETILAGPSFSGATLARWHFAHIAFTLVALMAGVLFWKAKKERPLRSLAAAPLVVAIVLALAIAAPLGMQATAADYGSYEAQVSWYTWPLHGGLNLFSRVGTGLGWIGSMAIPTLFLGFLLLAPWLERRVSGSVIRAVAGVFVLFFACAAVFFGGTPAPLVGNRDPKQHAAVQVANKPADPVLVAAGRKFFNENACMGCHGKDGANGNEGPDLRGVAKERGSDPKWYMDFIAHPEKVKPNTTMPGFPELSEKELRALAEFLIHLQ
jgi:quinol-cytochrome oxidoreductase complex cytochrome b subunit